MYSNNINHNGTILSAEEPLFTSQNRAFRYGDALFETIRIVDGKICFLREHFKRLVNGMSDLEMDIPTGFSYDYIMDEIIRLIDANAIMQGGRIRFTVYRKDGGYYSPLTNAISFLIEATTINENAYQLNKTGFKIDVYDKQKKGCNMLSNLKTSNSLLFVLAAIYKDKHQLDDCILTNEQGNIVEAISSNVFLVKDNTLFTPSLKQGCVDGIMRKQILSIAFNEGIHVKECAITLEMLTKADEVFLSNVVAGIRWVGGMNKRRYFNSFSKRFVDTLNEAMHAKV